MSDVQALAEAQKLVAPDPSAPNPERNLEPEETALVNDPKELPAGDTSIVVTGEEEEFIPTHTIGGIVVQQKQFANGLLYWVDATGKRRIPRPDKGRPLRVFIPKPEPAKQIWLDRDAMGLALQAYYAPDGRAEDDWNIGEKVDERHVKLSLRINQQHVRFLVQIPDDFEVVGTALP